MKLNCLDILSDSPKNFILKKEANKTNFGGLLAIIFLSAFLLLTILYILDYWERVYDLDSPYEIEYLNLLNTSLIDDREEINSDPDLNPNKTFLITLYSRNLEDNDDLYLLSDNFILFQPGVGYLKKEKNGSYIISGKLSDINLVLLYKCLGNNCTIRQEDKYDYYFFQIRWIVPTLTHQNPSFPVDENNLVYKYIDSKFSIYHLQSVSYYWGKIIYKEEKTLFNRFTFTNKKTVYEFWDIKENRRFLEDDIFIFENKIPLFMAKTINDNSSYIFYKRKSITFFDIIAKLASLFQTFYTIAFYVNKYYAKNFNNYKIIEKVLQTNTRNYREYKIRNNLYKQNDISPKYLSKAKEKLEYKLIDDDFDDDKIEKMSKSSRTKSLIRRECDANDELDDLLQTKIMPKFSFFRFFCNNLYCKYCCYKFRKQEFLHICDEIVLKYMSFDSILYNQIVSENIFKDYKWNDPILFNIENNELFDKLKNI